MKINLLVILNPSSLFLLIFLTFILHLNITPSSAIPYLTPMQLINASDDFKFKGSYPLNSRNTNPALPQIRYDDNGWPLCFKTHLPL